MSLPPTFEPSQEIGLTSTSKLIQDPFYPQELPSSPTFLDTGACLCSYRSTPETATNEAAWRCIGDQTQAILAPSNGTWFRPTHNETLERRGSGDRGPLWTASNGPDLSHALMYSSNKDQLIPMDKSKVSIYDAACTGKNQTTFSTAFYRAVEEGRNNETMYDALPCWRGLAAPVQLMTVGEWQRDGCFEGFLCQNNTINSLPQYCPPVDQCQEARLFGDVCQVNGSNIGTGPFEPVLCQGGYFCPSGGTQKISCPSGHYCQPGSASPTPCAFGSRCTEGSTAETFLIPFGILVILDTFLLLGMLLQRVHKRSRKSNLDLMNESLDARIHRRVTGRRTGYTTIAHESETWEHESFPHAANSLRRTGSGLEMVLAMSRAHGVDDAEHELPPELRSFVQSMRRATDAAHFGLSFQYSNLSLQPKGTTRPILQNVTGSIHRGALTAVMGGSGAGKSTFVNVLMGKIKNTGGSVMVNNAPNKMKRYKKLIGYVPQDDIVLPELTVYENIYHGARVRLPRTWTDAEARTHVDNVIESLQLMHIKDSLVGSVGKPVISGGQRKRVSIGMELAAAPMAIFLDEPTSGLDATAASSIVRTLKAIARIGISVVVIIHQPRIEIFEMLDELILLANGQVIYQGTEKSVRSYFEDLEFTFPPHANCGDIVTDIITGNGRQYKDKGGISKEWLIASWVQSSWNHNVTGKCRSGSPASRSQPSLLSLGSVRDPTMLKALKKRGAPRARQAWLCLCRAMLQQSRDKTAFWSEMILASLAAFLLGLAYHSKTGILFRGIYKNNFAILSTAVDIASAPQLALLMAVAIGLISSAPGVRGFSEEMLLQRREAEAGHSRVSYFIAKVVSVLPRMIIACFHFTTLVLVLARPVIPWGIAFLTNLAYFWCIYGLASIVSMITKRENAPLLATMSSLVLGILCGAAPSLATVQQWKLGWLWRMSPGVWFTELWFGQLINPFGYLYQTDLAEIATGLGLNWTWRNIGVLVGIGAAYRLLAYIGMVCGQTLRI